MSRLSAAESAEVMKLARWIDANGIDGIVAKDIARALLDAADDRRELAEHASRLKNALLTAQVALSDFVEGGGRGRSAYTAKALDRVASAIDESTDGVDAVVARVMEVDEHQSAPEPSDAHMVGLAPMKGDKT